MGAGALALIAAGSATVPAIAGSDDSWNAASQGAQADEPPATWQEHWFDHNQNLQRIDYNDLVALYFDQDVDPAAHDWVMPYLTNMWQYVRNTYGINGDALTRDRLYSILHGGKYYGGHPSTVYDESHDYRNVSDVGGDNWGTPQYEVVTHETGHIVEGVAAGKHGSPAFALWKDSKWNEFYIYDVYVALGMTDEAQQFYDKVMAGSDSFPRADTHWFRDWFFPLWRDYGNAQVMVRYFTLLGQYFPADGDSFSRDLNWGEYIHFTSGAAGKNLKDMATTAFGWPADWDAQFTQAQQDFPQITY